MLNGDCMCSCSRSDCSLQGYRCHVRSEKRNGRELVSGGCRPQQKKKNKLGSELGTRTQGCFALAR